MSKTFDRLLILGLDGATWTVLDPMRRRGLTPNLDALLARAAHGTLRSVLELRIDNGDGNVNTLNEPRGFIQWAGFTFGRTRSYTDPVGSWGGGGGFNLLHLQPTGKLERIRPSIGLYFASEPPVETPAILRLGRQNLDIPAGARDFKVDDIKYMINRGQMHAKNTR